MLMSLKTRDGHELTLSVQTMASKLPFMYWMSDSGKPRKSRRLQGLLPPLFWVCFEKVAGDHVSSMLLSDMDYPMMQNVYNLIRQRRMPQIERVVDQYGETYFRELIWTLKD